MVSSRSLVNRCNAAARCNAGCTRTPGRETINRWCCGCRPESGRKMELTIRRRGVNLQLIVIQLSLTLFFIFRYVISSSHGSRGGRCDGAPVQVGCRGSRVRVQYAPGAHGARPLARSEQRAYERHTPPLDTDSTTLAHRIPSDNHVVCGPFAFSSPSIPFLSKYPVSTFFHAPDFAPRRPLAPSSRS